MTDADRAQYERLLESLTNITPNADQVERIEEIRLSAKSMLGWIMGGCPLSRERSLALTHLEDMTMWAVKSIVMENA